MKRIALAAGAATLLFHLLANPHYGFYRDELYFIACGFHPDWGYVDQPPLMPLLAAGSQLFGHSLFAIRFVAALFAAASVYVTCLLVEEFGGGPYAAVLGALVALATPILAAFGMKITTDTAGIFLWPLLALAVTRALRGADARWWLAAGAVAGVAGLAKYSVGLFVLAIAAGIVLSGRARAMAAPAFWGGAAIAFALVAPSVLWQAVHGFPMTEMLHDQRVGGADVAYSPPAYILQQVLLTSPLLAPVWIAGIVYAFLQPRLRWAGWTCVLFLAALALTGGKNYYAGDLYPLPIAAGGVAIERWIASRAARTAIVAGCAIALAVTTPFMLPVMGEAQLAGVVTAAKRYVDVDVSSENNNAALITQPFADMHGWPELTAAVAGVYRSLPPDERTRAAILTSNFGEASAIDFFGGAYGLPPALSGHNNYFLWGTHGYDGSVTIEVNGTCAEPGLFAVRRVGVATFHTQWGMPSEDGIPISVCERPSMPLAAYWPRLKNYL